jgi:hypothetical protein
MDGQSSFDASLAGPSDAALRRSSASLIKSSDSTAGIALLPRSLFLPRASSLQRRNASTHMLLSLDRIVPEMQALDERAEEGQFDDAEVEPAFETVAMPAGV